MSKNFFFGKADWHKKVEVESTLCVLDTIMTIIIIWRQKKEVRNTSLAALSRMQSLQC